jgi:hypothetical protein
VPQPCVIPQLTPRRTSPVATILQAPNSPTATSSGCAQQAAPCTAALWRWPCIS